MPVDYNTAQSLIQQRGVQPPQGIQPGSQQYQAWATEWLKNAVNAGDPAAMQAAGVNAGTGWQGQYGQSPNGWDSQYGAGKGADWVGKRAPTPDELRQYSWDQGWGTDDYGDIPNSVLQQWITNAWDVNRGGFYTRSGKRVDKPTDSFGQGANADWVEGFAPGQQWSNYTAAMGKSMAGGGPATGQQAAASGGYNPVDPLQQKLMQMVGTGAGFFGENPLNNAASLKGGGVWWGQGADFSQEFNPLKPQGNKQTAQQNPFQQAAETATQVSNVTPTSGPQPNSLLAQYQSGAGPNPQFMKKLSQFYGGNNAMLGNFQ